MDIVDNESQTNFPPITDVNSDAMKRFFKLSFRHSEGDLDLQKYIFQYAIQNGYLKINPEEIPSKPKWMDELTVPHNHQHVEGINLSFQDIWDTMTNSFKNDHIPENLKVKITSHIISKDIYYQFLPREGRKQTTESESDGPNDIHASHLRRYAVLKENTGIPVLNNMYTEIFTIAENHATTDESHNNDSSFENQTRLPALIHGWERNHPGKKFLKS
ncbi:hypothetical protein BH10PAT1_BH10PAT1_2680 [soil metagenome]